MNHVREWSVRHCIKTFGRLRSDYKRRLTDVDTVNVAFELFKFTSFRIPRFRVWANARITDLMKVARITNLMKVARITNLMKVYSALVCIT